jgi:threonine synthase
LHYLSTRDTSIKLTAAQAIVQGLARDGGLFTPETLPEVSMDFISELCGLSYCDRAAKIMKLFLEEFSAEELDVFCREAYGAPAFDHPDTAPVYRLEEGLSFLELWHGPTSAFKDMALQMLPRLLTASMAKTGEKKEVCILVATSGDTGKAALEGFKDVEGTRILVFYPRDGVSDIQKLQMTTQEGKNVAVCAVEGDFDDTQSGVKTIFSDEKLRSELEKNGLLLSSANSINWGRLLPQIVYYFSAYCDLIVKGDIRQGEGINFCVPTGNFGNILAGYLARRMGLPVNKLICASNANRVLTDFFTEGKYDRNRKLYKTISPSMDILISSNLERLLFIASEYDDSMVSSLMSGLSEAGYYQISDALKEKLSQVFWGGCADDGEAMETIGRVFEKYGYLLDPHTAVAYNVYEKYKEKSDDRTHCVIVSTASPYKFCGSVLAALGHDIGGKDGLELFEHMKSVTGVEIPWRLKKLKDKASRFDRSVSKNDMKPVVVETLGISGR